MESNVAPASNSGAASGSTTSSDSGVVDSGVNSSAASDAASADAELKQAKDDNQLELTLTRLLSSDAVSDGTAAANSIDSYQVYSGSGLLGGSVGLSGPSQLKLPDGYEYLLDMTPEDAIVLINDRSASQTREIVQATVTRLEGSRDEYKKMHEQNLQKLQEYIEKAKSNLILQIFLFLILLLVFIIITAAAVLTAQPQLIVAAVIAAIALINSVLSVVSEITGEDVTFTGIARQIAEKVEEALIAAGMSMQQAEALGKMTAGYLGVITGAFLGDPGLLAMFYEGIAQSLGMDEKSAKIFGMVMSFIAMLVIMVATMNVGSAGSSISSAAGAIDDISKFASMSDDIVNAAQTGAQVAQAGAGMYQAKVQHDATILKADMLQIQAFLKAVRNSQELDESMLKDLVSHMGRMQEMANESIQTALKSSGAAFRSMA